MPDNTTDPWKSYLPGEDNAKFKTIEDLAKAKYESDRFIEQIKEENSGLRETARTYEEKLAQARGVDDILRAIKENSGGNVGGQGRDDDYEDQREMTNRNADRNQSGSTPVDEEFLQSTVQRMLQKERENQQAEQNWKDVESRFASRYSDAEEVIVAMKTTAKELGLSFEEFQAVSRTRPQLVLRAAGLESSKAANQGGTVRFNGGGGPRGPEQTEVRNQTYYNNLKNSLKAQGRASEFYSVKVQNQLHKDAAALGDAFFE